LSEVYIARSRGMGQITSAITISNFDNIKKDFEKLQKVLEIFDFIKKFFSEEEKDERIFELLEEFLKFADREDLDKKGKEIKKKRILVEAFWWKLFDLLGQRSEVTKCVACAKKLIENSKKFFSVEKGGVICVGCSPGFGELAPTSDNQIKLLRIFWGNPLSKIAKVKVGKEELEKLSKIRENFGKYNFG